MATIRVIVRGRVQGVGFRYFVSRQAKMFEVAGEVWNRKDGGVEVIAEHPSEQVLRDFADCLRDGPGYVSGVNAEPVVEGSYSEFVIGPTR